MGVEVTGTKFPLNCVSSGVKFQVLTSVFMSVSQSVWALVSALSSFWPL